VAAKLVASEPTVDGEVTIMIIATSLTDRYQEHDLFLTLAKPVARAAAACKARWRSSDGETAIALVELGTSSTRPRRSFLGGIEEWKEALAKPTTVRSRSGEATSMAVVAKTPNVALPQLA
jgi:hypothetical protein